MATAPASSAPRGSSGELVRLDDVCVHYGETVALAPCSVSISPSTSVALVGANGSGKTTLLSLIAGLVEPSAGRVTRDATVAMVTQHRHHHRWMPLSVDEVLRMGRYRERGLLGRLRRSDRAAIDAAAERLEVVHLRGRPFGELSGGQQQRVLVAQAIAAEPDVLLLDEPVTGLDLPSQIRILEVIEGHAAGGGAVVFSTHHLAEARRADRVLLLSGCVLADGAPAEVLRPELLAEAFGDRLLRHGDTSVLVDDHGHDHRHDEPALRGTSPHDGSRRDVAAASELVPHHALHHHEHAHADPDPERGRS